MVIEEQQRGYTINPNQFLANKRVCETLANSRLQEIIPFPEVFIIQRFEIRQQAIQNHPKT